MGLLDPVYAGVNSVIAGAGSVAGGAVSSGTSLQSLILSPLLLSTVVANPPAPQQWEQASQPQAAASATP